jgi:hypothetical protein
MLRPISLFRYLALPVKVHVSTHSRSLLLLLRTGFGEGITVVKNTSTLLIFLGVFFVNRKMKYQTGAEIDEE